jgi:hypothetical protein
LRLFACKGILVVRTSKPNPEILPAAIRRSICARLLWKTGALLIVSLAAVQLSAREKDAAQYGVGLIVNVPFPESEVALVVQDVTQNGLIRGTKEYNKDEYISGATPATSTKIFKEWTDGGKVFYKVRLKAIDPRNFKNGGDVGTLAVRYVIQPQGDKNTVVHIDALFVEDFRKTVHLSDGSVESAEYKDIHDRLDAIESMRSQTVEAEKEKLEQAARKQLPVPATEPAQSTETPTIATPSAPAPAVLESSSQVGPSAGDASPNPSVPPSAALTLEERVHDLRQQLERLVKAPGGALKSAPFHTASTLQSLPAGTEVMIVISTTYWVGVETHDGQHGWMLRDQLEQAP